MIRDDFLQRRVQSRPVSAIYCRHEIGLVRVPIVGSEINQQCPPLSQGGLCLGYHLRRSKRPQRSVKKLRLVLRAEETLRCG
jgi:hypothetical protein